MGFSTTHQVNQRHHHISTTNSPKVHTPPRTYHVPCDPLIVCHNNESTQSRIISTRASLPSLNSNTSTQEDPTCDSLRPSSANSTRRSVSGMKQLLPLRLSTSQISDSASFSTSASSKRSTFGHAGRLGGLSNSELNADPRLAGPLRSPIRAGRYRHTPIVSKLKLPLSGSPSHQETCIKCSDEEACTASCIIDEYEGFSDSSSSKGYSSDYSNQHTQSIASSPISSRRRYRADSEFSFKCMGEPTHNSGSPWFGNPTKDQANPRSSTVDIEGWLSDSASSMCGGLDDEDSDDFFACATALAPAKAHVVEVNHKQSPRLSIKIPKQSTLTAKLKRYDSFALRKFISPSPIKTSLTGDLSSPPTSPEEPASTEFSNHHQHDAHSPVDHPLTPASPDTILDIVAEIEECTSNFPAKMLLVDTPCISSIRSHLKATSAIGLSKSSPQQAAAPPAIFNQTRPKGINRRNRPETICLSPVSNNNSFNSQIPTTPPSTPPFNANFSFSSVSSTMPTTKSYAKSSILPTFAYQLAAANLQPLHTIFPISSDFLRSALYAHILAYIFLQSLPSSNMISQPASFSSNTRMNHHAASHSTSHSLRKQSSFPHNFSSYHNTSIVGIPAKAASTLGLSSSTSVRRNMGAVTQNKRIELNLRSCIGKLLKGMEGKADAQTGKAGVEGWILRSLIEVVRGCEGI